MKFPCSPGLLTRSGLHSIIGAVPKFILLMFLVVGEALLLGACGQPEATPAPTLTPPPSPTSIARLKLGLGFADADEFSGPAGIAVDGAGKVYVADTGNNRVQIFNDNGELLEDRGLDGGEGEFDGPAGIAVDGAGNVYVADTVNDRIQVFSHSGAFLSKWGFYGIGEGEFDEPEGIATGGVGNVYVADVGNDRVQIFKALMPAGVPSPK